MPLKKAMGLGDLVLFNIAAIMGLRWISTAAGTGISSILLWVLAMIFFFIPQGFCVNILTKKYPEEGGIYVWSKKAFGEYHGFLSGFCYWTNNLIYYPSMLAFVASISVYVLGKDYIELGNNKIYICAFTLVVLWLAIILNTIGLSRGKWLQNLGGIGTWIPGIILIIMGITSAFAFGINFNFTTDGGIIDSLSVKTVPFFAAMCFAFAGLELAPTMSGEIKEPARNIPRALVISGIVIAVIYIMGTLSLVLSIPHKDLNIMSGILQAIERLSSNLGLMFLVPVCAFLITLSGIGGAGAWLAGSARVPFVAGIDHYLPDWFGKVHPKWGTPYMAILAQGVISTVFVLMSFIGAEVEEAYMILLDTTLIVYFIPYIYMFGSMFVFASRKEIDLKPKDYVLSLFGLITTILAIILAIVPTETIENIWLFEIKVIGGCLGFILAATIIFYTAKKRRPS